jgi:hypothetical protein
MSHEDVSKAVSPGDIYEKWHMGTGPCEECPKRDDDHVTSPHFGFSNHPDSADVVILGESPGGKGSTAPAAKDGKRTWKNYRDVSDTVPEKIQKGPTDFSVGGLNRDDCGNYGDWKVFHDELSEQWDRVTSNGREIRLYYTNHTKCSDIHNKKHRHDHTPCPQHLIPELRYWDPDAIIAFHGPRNGGRHLYDVLSELGVSDVPEDNTHRRELVFDADEEPPIRQFWSDILDATVVCSYHWQQDIGNASSDWEDFADEYSLPEEIIETGSGFKRRYAKNIAETVIGEIGGKRDRV